MAYIETGAETCRDVWFMLLLRYSAVPGLLVQTNRFAVRHRFRWGRRAALYQSYSIPGGKRTWRSTAWEAAQWFQFLLAAA